MTQTGKDILRLEASVKRGEFFEIPLCLWRRTDALQVLVARISRGESTWYGDINVASLANLRENRSLFRAFSSMDFVGVDGVGILWGARLLGISVPERLAGVDLFQDLVAAAAECQFSVYLLGAEPQVLEETARRFLSRHPHLALAGCHHGYFGEAEEGKIVEEIRASGARMLFVGMPSPRKEVFLLKWREELGVTFMMGVGGSFDVIAGKVRRAPRWVQRSGLEWFFRMVQEPRRLFMRYFITNTKYFYLLICFKVKKELSRFFEN